MTLRLEAHGPVGHLVIDRAAKRNAFNLEMWKLLPELLARAMADDDIRVLVLRAAEPGVFCAGADIAEFVAGAQSRDRRLASQAAIGRAQHDLARAAKPVIAQIDGDCIGAGCGLALACDIRVATSRARFGITPAKLGLIYPLHDTRLLVDAVGPSQAKRMLFTAALIDAAEAMRIGLIDLLDADADVIARSIAANSPHSVGQAKGIVGRILDGQSDDDAATSALFERAFTLPDFKEGSAAFLERRIPVF